MLFILGTVCALLMRMLLQERLSHELYMRKRKKKRSNAIAFNRHYV